ncbi:MAG TPA: cation:proton antiporter [Methanoregulaceae archaeon]|nr:cation:proton antiporter [Methanoregulaceae archaeon]HQJ87352.1 cation:proton antiporter [Methanoregulaceae archaeon]
MSLLLFVALAGYLIASRINQSAVIGEILVGILVGPSVLGLITYTEFVQSLAHLGAIFLLFVIGFEFSLRDITNPRYIVIAIVGVLVPWIGGYLATTMLGYPTASALFVGTALTATSIAITANVLKELGRLDSPAARAIIGAAVIDDVLSLLVLGVTTDLIKGALEIPTLVTSLVAAVLFIGLGLLVGIQIVSPLLARLDCRPLARQYPEFVFLTALAIAFLYAMVAELIGLSSIVGAFIAGVSCREITICQSKDPREGAEYLQVIFAAIFFVSLGIIVDLHAVTPGITVLIVAITIVAILTKLIGCGLPARLFRYSWRESAVIGFGMAPRGEVAMIVALIGLNQGVIGQEIFVSILLMSLVTTIITPIVFQNWLFRAGSSTDPGTASD